VRDVARFVAAGLTTAAAVVIAALVAAGGTDGGLEAVPGPVHIARSRSVDEVVARGDVRVAGAARGSVTTLDAGRTRSAPAASTTAGLGAARRAAARIAATGATPAGPG
jgi:hypothetical protein